MIVGNPILIGGGSGGSSGSYPYNVSDFGYYNEDSTVTITWTDPEDSDWAGTLILAKQGNYPDGPFDSSANVIVDSQLRDQYSTIGYAKSNMEAGEWFFQAFPYSIEGEYSDNIVNRLQVSVDYIYPSSLSSFSVSAGNTKVILYYTLPEDASGVNVSYKAGSAPSSLEDGTRIDNPTSGHAVEGLTNGTTYYFMAQPYNEYGRYGASSTAEATPVDVQIYGISRDITVTSPEWARTDSAVGFTATASVGTAAGASSFDNVYPWNGIIRETLDTGDVMVKIPKFWYRRYRENNVEYIKIADGPAEGFDLHPAFNHGGIPKDSVYVAAYETSGSASSVSGANPGSTSGKTMPNMRNNAKNKGEGWGLLDLSTLSAVQMLFLVEFATYNSQSVLGAGHTNQSSSSSDAINCGSCDNVPNLTGRPTGTDGFTGIVYRGIENIWGDMWERVDGVNFKKGEYYICNDPSLYTSDIESGYTLLSYSISTAAGNLFVTKIGYDEDYPYAMLPVSAASSGSSTTFICDTTNTNTTQPWTVVCNGGARNQGGGRSGLFCTAFSNASSLTNSSYTFFGYRMMYIPEV